jgi:hypothetical protein
MIVALPRLLPEKSGDLHVGRRMEPSLFRLGYGGGCKHFVICQ